MSILKQSGMVKARSKTQISWLHDLLSFCFLPAPIAVHFSSPLPEPKRRVMWGKEQEIAIRRQGVGKSNKFSGKKGVLAWAQEVSPGGGLCQQEPSHLHGQRSAWQIQSPVTQMSQHDCRERIIVGACWPIFSRRAQDKEAEENR